MSPRSQHVLIVAVMLILVSLFAWIYRRDRRQRIGLWMFGWIAVLVHFAVQLLFSFSYISPAFDNWGEYTTLEIAGALFLVSVSKACSAPETRVLFLFLIALPSVLYTTCWALAVQSVWVFQSIILLTMAAALTIVLVYYRGWGFAKPILAAPDAEQPQLEEGPELHSNSGDRRERPGNPNLRRNWLFLCMGGCLAVIPGLWCLARLAAKIETGIFFFLFEYFAVTGFLFWRHHRRLTPGIVTTSLAFIAWGLVFPVGALMTSMQSAPSDDSIFWDLPKYFVAFGMILTLFENEAESAMRSAHQYRALFESNLAGIYISTLEGRLLNCNGAFARMYGFRSPEEALAHPAVSLYVEPTDRQDFIELLARQPEVVNHDCRQRRKDGSVFWVLERAMLSEDAFGRQVIEGTAIDITERKLAELALKQSEERFATVFRNSPVGCALVSPEGLILSVNEHALKLVGLPMEQVVGRTTYEVGIARSPRTRDALYQKLKMEGPIKDMQVEFTDASGSRHIGLYFATLVHVGEKDCIFGMYLDRTEQHKLEAKFLQSQKMEALGRLAGGVAHDFNNLLGVIGGYAELLEARLGRDDGHRKYCSKIIETTQRASGLTRQLLTFSRKEIMRPAPLQVDQAVRDLAGILSRLIGEHIELRTNLRASGTIIIDKTHFEQIVLNVVVNARDAMPHGGVLSIETLDQQRKLPQGPVEGQGCVVMRIRDTGVGMDEQTRQQAFEPFYTTKEMGRGTGLGLSTVYGIVQQCGGEIGIESKLGKWTEITIVLPAAMAREMVEESGEVEELAQGSGHILLVEDEADLRHANAEFLISLGYSVTCAASGPEALQVAGRYEGIDLVISDVVMPKMSGREFADRLLQDRPNTKVLFVSGYADDVVLQAGISTLGTPFLQKPFSLKQLGSKVREMISVEAR